MAITMRLAVKAQSTLRRATMERSVYPIKSLTAMDF